VVLGDAAGEGNTIAFNGGAGVAVKPTSIATVDFPAGKFVTAAVRRNSIYSNGGLGIDLNGEGVTPNDAGDPDAFPFANNSQNFPIITSVATGPALGTANIQGTLNSKPNTAYTLDFFTSAACDPSGNGEGARLFGSAGVNTDAIKELLDKRRETQPIGEWSCGSVFTNPQGDHAARLIEASGLKGFRIGGASVSEKHANFIINHGEASAADIEALIQRVQKTVAEKQGVQLQTEVRVVGEPA